MIDLLLLIWYTLMFWVRRRFKRTHDFRIGIAVTGLYVLATGVSCIRYAGELGFISLAAASGDCVRFVVFMAIVILVSVIVFSFWKLTLL